MLFDIISLTVLTFVAADLDDDLRSASEAVSTFEWQLEMFSASYSGGDAPTYLTSYYESFTSALTSLNGVLEGVNSDSLGMSFYDFDFELMFCFSGLGSVAWDLHQIAGHDSDGTGSLLSFIQDVIEGMSEPSAQLVERVNSIIGGNCSIDKPGYSPSDGFWVVPDASSFSSEFTSVASELSVHVSLPTVACISDASASTAHIISTSTSFLSRSSYSSSSRSRSSSQSRSSSLRSRSSTTYASSVRIASCITCPSTTRSGRSSSVSEASESSVDEDSQLATTSGVTAGAPQSSIFGGSTSAFDSSASSESLEESTEAATTSASSSEAGGSSTTAASVTSGRAPILTANVGLFVPLFVMLL